MSRFDTTVSGRERLPWLGGGWKLEAGRPTERPLADV
jgi:hypothetical protein